MPKWPQNCPRTVRGRDKQLFVFWPFFDRGFDRNFWRSNRIFGNNVIFVLIFGKKHF